MANSSSIVTGNARVSQDRHSSYSLQQHDSATTLDLSGNMEFGKPDSLEADVKMLDQQTLRDFGMAAKRAGSVASGFASRDTSPERGSIASYRAGSRPGTAQTYSAAEVRRQYAGKCSKISVRAFHSSFHSTVQNLEDMFAICAAGPRSFASSSAKRPGLETGDIVALMSEVKTVLTAFTMLSKSFLSTACLISCMYGHITCRGKPTRFQRQKCWKMSQQQPTTSFKLLPQMMSCLTKLHIWKSCVRQVVFSFLLVHTPPVLQAESSCNI